MLKVEPLTVVSEVPCRIPSVDWLPRMLGEFSEIQRYVLARVATHSLRLDGKIPYIPPTALQRDIAFSLVDVRLLEFASKRPAFRLSRLGLLVASRLFRLVPARWSIEHESEFEFFRALMCNRWETR
jgi:hypothetical protein